MAGFEAFPNARVTSSLKYQSYIFNNLLTTIPTLKGNSDSIECQSVRL
jgi:hypothetical protein